MDRRQLMVMGELPVEAEVLVIGGGPAGYAAAFRAADLGLDVTLVTEEPRLGGVCLLRGCIPSKTLLSLTELMAMVRAAATQGIRFGEPTIDLEAMRAWKEMVVTQLADGLAHLCAQRDIRLVQARATFSGLDTVHVDHTEAQRITFKHGIMATGSRPIPLPGTAFTDRIMDASKALELEDIPQRLLVIGGSYVGLELGQVYARLGSEVTLVEMTDRLLPHVDADLVQPLARRVRDLFAGVYLKTTVTALEQKKATVRAAFAGKAVPSHTTYDRVLVAIGRQPNTDHLGLETADVNIDAQGYVIVDQQRRITNARLFAIGDMAGGMLLAHKALHEGKVAAEVIAGQRVAFDARAIPAVVYTDPQIAWCGLTEHDATAQHRPVKVARFPWKASGRAVTMGAIEGCTKIVMDPASHGVLGMGVVGQHAEALIAEGVLAVEMGAVAKDVALAIHPHPTLSETVGEAAEVFCGSATHILPRKK
jgi:dihydrolipoamide dehydrogenase